MASYLEQQKSHADAHFSQTWSEIDELYTRKLWHQLTLKLLECVKNPAFQPRDGLMKLYDQFISEFEQKISPIHLVEICLMILRSAKDQDVEMEFLNKMEEKVKHSMEAKVLVMISKGFIWLQKVKLDDAKKSLSEIETSLEGIDGITSVHYRFYDLASRYHQLVGNHTLYYRQALRFLGCADMDDIPVAEKQERAFNLSLAALLGDDVYNFGELLAHDVLNNLKNTDKSWLIDVLLAFNSGDIPRFLQLKDKWSKQPDLAANEHKLQQKIRLLCLMEMTFKRPANHRQLSFDDIANTAQIGKNEVEWLVMRALSRGLVKGDIDEVDQKVHMTWVQPRVLDLTQITSMKERLDTWCTAVSETEHLIKVSADDILT